MHPLSIGLLSTALLLLGLGVKMTRGRPFFVDAKLLYAVFLLSLFLPFPFWMASSLRVPPYVWGVIVLFGVILLYPLVRMPRTFAVFNAERDRTAALLRETLEQHGIAYEVAVPHYGEPVKLRPGLSFRPHEGWRFSFSKQGVHILVGRLLTPSIALVSPITCKDLPGLEEAFSRFRRALRAGRRETVPSDAKLLLVAGTVLFLCVIVLEWAVS